MTDETNQEKDLPQAEKPVQKPEQELAMEDLEQVAGGFSAKNRQRPPKKAT